MADKSARSKAPMKQVRSVLLSGIQTLALAVGGCMTLPEPQLGDGWAHVAQGDWEQRYSPLSQINPQTVEELGLEWYADMDTAQAQEATPIVVDGVLYVTTAWSMVKAFDAVSGRPLWSYDPQVAKAKGADACCGPVNRGVAYADGKLFLGALDGRLIALDAKTGAVVWSEQTTDIDLPYTITGAPRVANGKVIIGNGGAEYRVRGYVSAYDVQTGEMVWRWYSVPGDPSLPFEQPELELAAKTWNGTWWDLGGGGTIWDGMAFDPQLNSLYVGTGNGTPWNQAVRSPGGGDNLFLASVVALDPDTGAYKCHFQETPAETWDYTSAQPIIIAELDYATGPRKVLLHAPKNGFFYVLDAEDCQPVSVAAFAPMTWATGWDAKTNRPIETPEARYDKTGEAVIVTPFATGAHNWHPMAFSPQTGLVYLPVTVSNAPYAPAANFEPKENGWNTGTDFRAGYDLYNNPGAPQRGEIESYLLAWDPVAQKEIWRVPNAVYGASGVMASAGGIVFSGNHAGEFAAYEAASGRLLWKANAGARVIAAPSSYSANGRQYVAILVGANGLPSGQAHTSATSANNSRLLVFGLDGNASLPDEASTSQSNASVPPTALPQELAAGAAAYRDNCAVCHGSNGVAGAGATAPDLRNSALLGDRAAFNQVVLDGERGARGMPGFGQVLSVESAAQLRAYLTAIRE